MSKTALAGIPVMARAGAKTLAKLPTKFEGWLGEVFLTAEADQKTMMCLGNDDASMLEIESEEEDGGRPMLTSHEIYMAKVEELVAREEREMKESLDHAFLECCGLEEEEWRKYVERHECETKESLEREAREAKDLERKEQEAEEAREGFRAVGNLLAVRLNNLIERRRVARFTRRARGVRCGRADVRE
jgi:hypothetical protein